MVCDRAVTWAHRGCGNPLEVLGMGWWVLMLNLEGQVEDGQRKEKWGVGWGGEREKPPVQHLLRF